MTSINAVPTGFLRQPYDKPFLSHAKVCIVPDTSFFIRCLVSGHNLQADCQCLTLVPSLNSGANTAPRISACAGVGHGSLR